MNEWALFATLAVAHLLAVMSPGPDFAMVSRQTLRYGRRAGLLTSAGIASGIVVHVAWGLFGLDWLAARLPALLPLLRLAGAGFLLWMGLRALLGRPGPPAPEAADAATPPARHYLLGLATNLLNPKAMLFFLALCSGLVTQGTSTGLRLAAGAWIVLSTAGWFSLVALGLGHPRVRQTLLARAQWLDRGMGLLLVLLAGLMLRG